MILVTGGCGYIGSHFILHSVLEGKDVICVDNLSNSNLENLLKINQVSKKEITFINGNVGDVAFILDILDRYKVTTVAHFAGYKSILESIQNPFKYFQNNVIETLSLINAMSIAKVNKIIFSSSATVYGNSKSPLFEKNENDFIIFRDILHTTHIIEYRSNTLLSSFAYLYRNTKNLLSISGIIAIARIINTTLT